MKFHKTGREVNVDTDEPVVSGCYISVDRDGIELVWDEGGKCSNATLSMDDVLETYDIVTIDGQEPPTDADVATLYDEWGLKPDFAYEDYDAIVKASAVPCCDPDEDDPWCALRERQRNNMMHDPNFHASMEGASRREKFEVASDMVGLPIGQEDSNE
jgi:hypothetical protein